MVNTVTAPLAETIDGLTCRCCRFVNRAGGGEEAEESARARAELARVAQLSKLDGDAPEAEGAYWAYAHGLACLLLDGPLAGELTTLDSGWITLAASIAR